MVAVVVVMRCLCFIILFFCFKNIFTRLIIRIFFFWYCCWWSIKAFHFRDRIFFYCSQVFHTTTATHLEQITPIFLHSHFYPSSIPSSSSSSTFHPSAAITTFIIISGEICTFPCSIAYCLWFSANFHFLQKNCILFIFASHFDRSTDQFSPFTWFFTLSSGGGEGHQKKKKKWKYQHDLSLTLRNGRSIMIITLLLKILLIWYHGHTIIPTTASSLEYITTTNIFSFTKEKMK